MSPEQEQLAYPIGRFETPLTYDEMQLQQWMGKIEAAPRWYDYVIENLDEAQLQTPYRPGGWTMHQVVHHVADSHVNAYVRLKLALTEQSPEIKPYEEKRWAELPDVAALPVNVSITLLHALHRRWVAVLHRLQPEEWERSYFHPDMRRSVPLWEMTAMYAWHGRHHFEQLFRLRERMGW